MSSCLMVPATNNWTLDIHYKTLYHDIKATSGPIKNA